MSDDLVDQDYRRLLELRTGLRRFMRWSEEGARVVGLTPAQHQLLIAVRGLEAELGPTIGDVADALLLRHHSAVELVQRAEGAGLLTRSADADDGRVVRLGLSRRGRNALERLSGLHAEELDRLSSPMHPPWAGLDEAREGR
jgi:DNA-binding MarR family transcriptional regulator